MIPPVAGENEECFQIGAGRFGSLDRFIIDAPRRIRRSQREQCEEQARQTNSKKGSAPSEMMLDQTAQQVPDRAADGNRQIEDREALPLRSGG